MVAARRAAPRSVIMYLSVVDLARGGARNSGGESNSNHEKWRMAYNRHGKHEMDQQLAKIMAYVKSGGVAAARRKAAWRRIRKKMAASMKEK